MRKIALIISVMLLSIIISFHAGAETEPNDSLDSPEILTAGSISGELNTNETVEDLFEKDCFRLDMEQGDLYFISLKKTDTFSKEIEITYYNEEFRKEGLPSTLSVAGQRTSREIRPIEDRSLYIVLSGKGEYILDIHHEDLNDRNDHGNEFSDPELLSHGDTAVGKVFEIDVNGTEYSDVDLYKFQPERTDILKITITRTDDDDGDLNLSFFSSEAELYPFERNAKLGKQNEKKVFEYEGSYSDPDVVFLKVSGEGEYKIEVSQEPVTISEEEIAIILSMMAMMMCLPFLGFLIPVIIIIIVIIVIVKSQKKEPRRKVK